jgi:hypothetical protein
VTPGEYRYLPGASGLSTAMLTCLLTAPAELARPAVVAVANRYAGDRVGWHELTAVGDGVRLVGSALPGRSQSDELRAYPPVPDPASVLDVRTATLRAEPGRDGGPAEAERVVPAAGPLARVTSWAERGFERVAGGRLTPPLAALAVLLALVLGAAHAALPGHGKTVLAAWRSGWACSRRQHAIAATITRRGSASPAWGWPAGWYRARPRSSCCSRPSGWAGRPSGSSSRSRTAWAWRPR